MLKRTLTYTNGNDEEVTEDFYFHLSQAELIEMEVEYSTGLAAALQKVIDSKDRKEIIRVFKDLVLRSYGEKTDDGRGFEKSDDIRRKFANSFAYSTLFMELATDDKAASNFVIGIMPGEFAEVMKQQVAQTELQAKTAAALTKVPGEGADEASSDPPSA